MPKKSAGGKNAFYFFMVELKEKQGRKYKSLKEAAVGAAPLWEKMNAEQRKPYITRASKATGTKMTSLQEDMDLVSKQEEDLKNEEIAVKTAIRKIVNQCISKDTLAEEMFHILHINNFCYANSTEKNYPAEIAIIRFNLSDGVLKDNIYHEIINPGKLPIGYSFKARSASTETHKIQVPDEGAVDTQGQVMQKLMSFMNVYCDQRTKNIPPIFVDEKIIHFTRKVFDTWCHDFQYDRDVFQIYSLQYLFYMLRNSVADHIVWPNASLSAIELSKDIYDYTPGISCDYHEMAEVLVHCSQSIVTRYVFLICDNCCPMAGIKLIPGQHVPIQSSLRALNADFDRESCYSEARSRARTPRGDMSSAQSVASECHLSFVTDTNTVFEDVASHFDDDEVREEGQEREEAEDDGWVTARSGKNKHAASSRGRDTPLDTFESAPPSWSAPSGSDSTPNPAESSAARAPLRRPNSVSAAAGGVAFNGHTPFSGKGRGRGNWK